MERDILILARELILLGWTQGASARDKAGERVHWASDRAAQFCLRGAITRAAALVLSDGGVALMHVKQPPNLIIRVLALLHASIGLSSSQSLSAWNDDPRRVKSDVLIALDRAIAHCAADAPAR